MFSQQKSAKNLRTKILIPTLIFIPAFIYFEYVTVTQYASQHFFLADIGVIDSAIAHTLRGEFLPSPISGWNYLAVHFRPILLLFVPLYFIYDHILTLSTLFNLALIGALYPLYLFAFEKTRYWWLAVGFALSYIFNHFTLSLHLALHPESLLMIGFFAMFLAVERKINWLYWLGACWALAIKEDIAVFVASYGVYLAFVAKEKQRKLGLATVGVAIGWLCIAGLIMHLLRPAEGVYKGGTPLLQRYASLGSSWGQIIVYSITHPWEILSRIFSRPALYVLLLSLGFLPLLHPRSLWLVIIPALIVFISDFEPMYKLLYYYSYPFIPFIFLSAIEGATGVLYKWKNSKYIIMAILLITAICSFLTPTRTDNLKDRPFKITEHHRLLKPLIKRYIPPDASVAAQYELFCQLPHRRVLLPLWLENIDKVEYVIIDTRRNPPDLTTQEKAKIIQILSNPPFQNIAMADGYVIFRRENRSNP
ncbi:DUF2079 domain-containing protein [Candidatus Sumerlaeota bacterium]|nr:DUF2079 domain-containing protein [Candidatus Sumerlaeota bacterium]